MTRGPAGPLFVTRTGARWRPGNAARALTALATHVEIPGATRVTPHALRHAAITLALDAGVPLHEVQDFAGHRDPRSTRRYDRARGPLDRHASNTLAPTSHELTRSGAGTGAVAVQLGELVEQVTTTARPRSTSATEPGGPGR